MPLERDAIRLRGVGAADAEAVATLHVASWRATYRGSFSDAYLDGPIEAERASFWRTRLDHPPAGLIALLAEDEAGAPLGFICGFAGHDARWGTLIDNLHVKPDLKGAGLGRRLMRGFADALRAAGSQAPVHLFVLARNDAARGFYARLGGTLVERINKLEPDGTAQPVDRIAWPSLAAFLDHTA
jgi:ribosomal protein S18 acetylase RimI-like enzyme